MTHHYWPGVVASRLGEFLTEAFPGVQFQTVPLVAYDVATIDVAWTDGPSLHEMELRALEFVMHIHMDIWGATAESKIDRVSNRRTMSPPVEAMLLAVLAGDMGLEPQALDMDQFYPLPRVLDSARYSAEKGTIPEFLDMLFEATSFSLGKPVAAQSTFPCTCALCA